MSPEMRNALFYLQMHQQCVWRQGSARTRWGSLQHSPNPLAGLKGRGGERGVGNGTEGEMEEEGEGKRKWEDPNV